MLIQTLFFFTVTATECSHRRFVKSFNEVVLASVTSLPSNEKTVASVMSLSSNEITCDVTATQ